MKRVVLSLCVVAPLLAQSSARLRADLQFLTSDVLAGRLSLTPQADIAARYIAAEFARSGLQPASGASYLQEFPLVAYRPEASGRQLLLTRAGGTKAFRSEDFAGGFFRDVDVKAAVVFCGYGITAPEYGYDDYAGIDVTGKVVLLFDHEPQEDRADSVFNGTGHTLHAGRWMKLRNARRHGAVGVLIAGEPLRHHRGPLEAGPKVPDRGSAPPQTLDDSDQIPAFSIGDEALRELLAGKPPAQLQEEIDAGLKPRSQMLPDTVVEMRAVTAEQRRGTSLNAVGLLEGGDPALKAETILITAHYDHLGVANGHVYPGANDNASGTVAVMELARLFAQSPARPKRSLLFVVFGSEEESMLGSFYYTAHPLRPLATTRAAINLDMIGRDEAVTPETEGVVRISADTSNEISLIGSFYSPELRALVQSENKSVGLTLGEKFDQDHRLNVLFRCDHLPFLIAGVPSVWFFGGFHPGYHEPSDTVEKLNFAKLEKVTLLAYRTARAAADAPVPPRFAPAGR